LSYLTQLICSSYIQGKLYAWGSPQYGQLGNGTEGKSLEKAGRESFAIRTSPGRVKGALVDATVTQVACGLNHALALDSEGKVYAWGFGGYGR
jgi:alpha-tubulin suppressor-like RCC1 family protein